MENKDLVIRDQRGRFLRGGHGISPGRPPVQKDVVDLCKASTLEAVETLRSVMRDENESGAVRCGAAVALLDRAWGKPGTRAAEIPSDIVGDAEIEALRRDLRTMMAESAARNRTIMAGKDQPSEPEILEPH